MTIRRSFAYQGGLLLLALFFSFAMAPGMPDRVVIHWGAGGEPNGWGSKWTSLLMMPVVQALQTAFTLALPALTPKRDDEEGKEPILGWVMFLVAALLVVLHVTIVLKSAGASFDIVRVLLGVIFLSYVPLGNVLGKIEPNRYVGIRTPWTFSSERVWRASHRATARLWFAGGVLGALAVFAGLSTFVLLAYLLAISLLPIAGSYMIYKKLGRG